MKVIDIHILKSISGISEIYNEVLELEDGSAVIKHPRSPLRPITVEEFQTLKDNQSLPELSNLT